MAREGELFVFLELTIEELRRRGGRYQYQQVVVSSLIQEFGTEVRVICQTPPLACFQLNNGNIPFPRIPLGGQHNPANPGDIRLLGQCLHLGYISDFFIIEESPSIPSPGLNIATSGNLIQELWTTSLSRSQSSAPSNKMLLWKTYVLMLCCL
jgi:hypothetical protein